MRTSRSPRRPGRAAGREAGYNMVILVIAVTVLNIMLAMALPHWSHLIRRDKEEELRSRGLQYAEAVRVFQMRFGRLPVRLEELIEVKPRSIRRLWKDPMTKDGKWGILFQGVPPGTEGTERDPNNPGLQRVTIGPIVGVHSRSEETALSTFFGATNYDQWLFTLDLLQRGPAFRADHIPHIDLSTLGRPFGYGLEIAMPIGSQVPGQELGGGGIPGQPGGGFGGVPGQPGRQPNPRIPNARIPPGQFPSDPGSDFPSEEPDQGFPDPDRPSDGSPGFPGRPGPDRPPNGFPGFPGNPGVPGSPGGTPPGGTPPGGAPGFDPTQPNNFSPSSVLPSP